MPKTSYRSPQPSLSGNRRILLIASYLDGGRDAARTAQRFGVAPQLVAQLLAEIKAQGLIAWCMAQRTSDLSSSRNQELLQAEAESGGRLQQELEQLNLFHIDAFRLASGAALERHHFTPEAVAKLFHVPESDVFKFQRKLRTQGYDKWLTQYTKQDIALVQPEVKVTMSPFLTDTAPRLERSRAAHPPVNSAGAANEPTKQAALSMSGERRIHITLAALSQARTVTDLSLRFQLPATQIVAWQQEAQAQGVYQWCQEQRKRDEADAQAMLQIARERLQAKHQLDAYTQAYAQVIAVGAVLDQKVSVAKAAKILGLNEAGVKRLVKQAQGRERAAWAKQLLASVPKPAECKTLVMPAKLKSHRPSSADVPSSSAPHQPRVFSSKLAPAQTPAPASSATSSAAASAPRVFSEHTSHPTKQQTSAVPTTPSAAAQPTGAAAAAHWGNSMHAHKSHRLSQLKRQTLLTAQAHSSGTQTSSAAAQAAPATAPKVTPKLTGVDRIRLLAAYVDKQFSLSKLTESSGLSADELAQLEAEAKEQGLIDWCIAQHRRDQGQKLKSSLNLYVSCDIPWFTAAALSAVRAQQYSLETVAAILNLDQDELRAQLESQSKPATSTSRAEPKGTTTQVQVLSAPAPELKPPPVASVRPATEVTAVGKGAAAQQTSKLAPTQAKVAAVATQVQAAPQFAPAAQPKPVAARPTPPQPVAPRATGEQISFGHPPVVELSAPEAHLASLSQSMATLAATAPRTKVKFKYPKQAQLESAGATAAKAEATPAQASAGADTAGAAPQLSGVDRIRLVAALSCEPCDYDKLQAESGLSREQLEALKSEALAQGLIPWCQAQHQLDQEHHAQAQLPQLKLKVDCTASDLFGQAAAEAVHAQGMSPEQVAQLLLFDNAEDVSVFVDLYYSDAADKAPQTTPATVPTEHSTGAGAPAQNAALAQVSSSPAALAQTSADSVPETAQPDAAAPTDNSGTDTAPTAAAGPEPAQPQAAAVSAPNAAAAPVTGAAPLKASSSAAPKPAASTSAPASSAVGPAPAAPPDEARQVMVSPAQATGFAAQDALPDVAAAALSALNGASRIALAAAFLSGKFTPEQLVHAAPGLTPDALTRLKAELAAANLLEWSIDQRYLDQKQGLGSQLTLPPELLVERAALVEFRAAAVQGVLTKKMAAAQVAALLGLAESSVTTWVQEAEAQGYEAWLETTRARLQQAQGSAVTVSSEPQLRPVSGRRLIELVAAHYAKGFSPRLLGQIVGVSAATIESCLAQLKEQGLYAWCQSQYLADRADPELARLLAREDEHPLPPDFQVERRSLAPFKQAALQALRAPGNSPEAVGAILGLDPVQIKAWFLAEASAPVAPVAPVASAAPTKPAQAAAPAAADAAATELVGTQRVNVLIELLECEQAGIDHESVCRAYGLSAPAATALIKEAGAMGLVAWCEAQAEPEHAVSDRAPVPPRDGSLLTAFQLAAVEAVLKQGRSVATVASLLHLPRGQLATWSSQAMIQGFEHWAQSFDPRSQDLALGAQYWEEEQALAEQEEPGDAPQVAAAAPPDELISPELKHTALQAVQEQGHSPELVAQIMGLKLEQLQAWLKPTTLTTATSSTTPTAAPGKSDANLSNLSGERCLRIVAAYRSAQLSSAELCARYQVSEVQVRSLVQAAQQQGLISWATDQRERDDRSAKAAALARRDCVQLGLDLKLDEVAGLRYEAVRAVLQDGMAAVAVAALLGLRLPQLMAWVQEAQDH